LTSAGRVPFDAATHVGAEAGCGDCGQAEAPKLSLPVGFTVFPDELFQAPRSWAEKVYPKR
jgi:hypothetical protein